MKQENYTIDNIRARRLALKKKIRTSGDIIADDARRLLTPEPIQPGVNGLVQVAKTGFAIFDGIRAGRKIVEGLKYRFSRKKH